MDTYRRHSRENRSKRSLRSSSGSVTDASKLELYNAIVEKRLQLVLEEEQQKLIIYSVREDLMQRVMEECNRRYMERQCVNFTVQCAYRAIVQLANLGLFYHDAGKPFYTGHPSWLDDKPPQPSEADSWAIKQVAFKPKPFKKPLTPIPSDVTATSIEVDEMENVFTGIEAPKSEPSIEVDQEEDVHVLYQAENMEETGELESNVQLRCPPGTEASLAMEEEQVSLSREPLSIFTQTTHMPKEYLPHSMKSARSKLKGFVIKSPENPVLNLDETSSVKSKLSVAVFPPLRSDTKYKEKLEKPQAAVKKIDEEEVTDTEDQLED